MLVGAVHYASFCISKRAAMEGNGKGHAEASAASHDTTGANLFAATVGALSTALVESPVELFRHQAQAGLVQGSFVTNIAGMVQRGGLGALYGGSFVAFLAESFPYDITVGDADGQSGRCMQQG